MIIFNEYFRKHKSISPNQISARKSSIPKPLRNTSALSHNWQPQHKGVEAGTQCQILGKESKSVATQCDLTLGHLPKKSDIVSTPGSPSSIFDSVERVSVKPRFSLLPCFTSIDVTARIYSSPNSEFTLWRAADVSSELQLKLTSTEDPTILKHCELVSDECVSQI